MIKKTFIRGVQTYAFTDRDKLLDLIKNQKKILVAINAEKILKDNSKLKEIINRNIGYPDGTGAVMALYRKGFKSVKIPGAELWLDIIRRFQHDKSFYLLGSSQEVIDATVEKLKKEFPSLKLVGYRNGFLDEKDKEKLQHILIDKKPDIVFVAQGSPRQEFLMDELIKIHPALYMGLGGSFDVYSGFKERAPKIFLKLQLEWLFRLLKEPTMFRRELVLVKFLLLLILGKL